MDSRRIVLPEIEGVPTSFKLEFREAIPDSTDEMTRVHSMRLTASVPGLPKPYTEICFPNFINADILSDPIKVAKIVTMYAETCFLALLTDIRFDLGNMKSEEAPNAL